MRIYPISYNKGTVIIEQGIVILQNCMVLLKVEPDSYSETCFTSSHSGTQEVTDVQEEEDPLLIPVPVTEVEHEVNCVWVCLEVYVVRHVSQILRISCSLTPLHLSVYPHGPSPPR
jgi:hypothetical protein